jgi:hypothetical protein
MAAGTATVPGSADHQTQRLEGFLRIVEGGKIWVHYRGMLDMMNSGFVHTAMIRNPDEDNKEIPVDYKY